MVFSDTSGLAGLIQDCEDWIGRAIASDATLLKKFTRNINTWYHKVVTMILKSQDEWDFDDSNHTDYPILTTPLVASQRDYVIPVSEKVLRIKRVDVTYDGTTWHKAEPFDINEAGVGFGGNNTEIDARFTKDSPKYDMQANAFFLYPMASAADVTAGGSIRVIWTREIDEFTTADTTQEPGFDEPFHRILSMGASYDYAIQKGLPIAQTLKSELLEYEGRLVVYYGSKQEDRDMSLGSAYVDYR